MTREQIRQRVLTIVAFVLIAAAVGTVVVVSGVVPIKASSGHWAITKWFLDFSKTRSVSTHSMGIEVPPLDDPALIIKGAGHYETGCVQCHGSPVRAASPIALSMTAKPPPLTPLIPQREPEELFYVIKHGIKFTGMPAWPTQHRDDEVWAMTAFLMHLPNLNATSYLELVRPADPEGRSDQSDSVPAALSESVLENCRRCHGYEGRGRGLGAFPILAGQTKEYLIRSLEAYAVGERRSGMMQPVAAVLSREEIEHLADYYSSLTGPDSTVASPRAGISSSGKEDDSSLLERGESIARTGVPEHSVPSCIECHGPAEEPRDERYPRLEGQYLDYLVSQLQLFKSGQRGGTDAAHLMQHVVPGLTADDLLAVARYYASLKVQGSAGGAEGGAAAD